MSYTKRPGLAMPGLKVAPMAKRQRRPPAERAPRKRASSAKPRAPKKPCQYGDRDAKGRCPCKYGPRTARGVCPRKPKSLTTAIARDLKSGASPGRRGSATRGVADAAITNVVMRQSRVVERKVTTALRRTGAAAFFIEGLRRLAVPISVLVGAHLLSKRYEAARKQALADTSAVYRKAFAELRKTYGDSIPAAEQVKLSEWLRKETERINALYDQRGIEERQG